MLAVGVGVFVSNAFSHRGLYLSFFSMIYPVIGAPPSDVGSIHLRSTWLADQSVGSGAPGFSGLAVISFRFHFSANLVLKINLLKGSLALIVPAVSNGSDSPSLLTALTLNL